MCNFCSTCPFSSRFIQNKTCIGGFRWLRHIFLQLRTKTPFGGSLCKNVIFLSKINMCVFLQLWIKQFIACYNFLFRKYSFLQWRRASNLHELNLDIKKWIFGELQRKTKTVIPIILNHSGIKLKVWPCQFDQNWQRSEYSKWVLSSPVQKRQGPQGDVVDRGLWSQYFN